MPPRVCVKKQHFAVYVAPSRGHYVVSDLLLYKLLQCLALSICSAGRHYPAAPLGGCADLHPLL